VRRSTRPRGGARWGRRTLAVRRAAACFLLPRVSSRGVISSARRLRASRVVGGHEARISSARASRPARATRALVRRRGEARRRVRERRQESTIGVFDDVTSNGLSRVHMVHTLIVRGRNGKSRKPRTGGGQTPANSDSWRSPFLGTTPIVAPSAGRDDPPVLRHPPDDAAPPGPWGAGETFSRRENPAVTRGTTALDLDL